MSELSSAKGTYYFNSNEQSSVYDFCHKLRLLVGQNRCRNQDMVIVCIGSDRATGDCLGPIIGYKLSRIQNRHLHVYGTLSSPVHAKNLESTVNMIKEKHPDALVVAVDASLGTTRHVGFITLGKGTLKPGSGVNKELPSVGDIFITGIVNISGFLSNSILQTTRLHVVMRMADLICTGIHYLMQEELKEKIHEQ